MPGLSNMPNAMTPTTAPGNSSITKIQRHNYLQTEVPSHVEHPYPVCGIVDRVIFEPAHIIHIRGIEQVGADKIDAASSASVGNDIPACTDTEQHIPLGGSRACLVFKRCQGRIQSVVNRVLFINI